MEVGGERHAPAALPPGKTRYPMYRRLGGPQSWSGRVRKISPPQGFDPRTVQLVASRYSGSPSCPQTWKKSNGEIPCVLLYELPQWDDFQTSYYEIKLREISAAGLT